MNHKYRIQYISHGFWNYTQELFEHKTKLYEAQDILFPGANSKYEEPVINFYNSLMKISKKIKNSKFADFNRLESFWNLYVVPFETSSVKQIKFDLMKLAKKNPKIDMNHLNETMITEGVFFSVNYLTKVEGSIHKRDKRLSTAQIFEIDKKKTPGKKGFDHGFINSSKSPSNKVHKKRTSISVQVSG